MFPRRNEWSCSLTCGWLHPSQTTTRGSSAFKPASSHYPSSSIGNETIAFRGAQTSKCLVTPYCCPCIPESPECIHCAFFYCSNQLTDNVQSLLYNGLLEELVEVLEMNGGRLMEIKAAALKALTSIIHLDRNPNFPKLNTIIDVTGASR